MYRSYCAALAACGGVFQQPASATKKCEGQGNFGGSCEANFQCEGDAIQCAIAKQQHIRNCQLFDDKSEESDLYKEEKGKEGKQTEDLEGNEEIDLSDKLDKTNALGGGSCIGDLSIAVMGRSVTLPISIICPYLNIFGNILVAISMIIAIRIVGIN